MTDEFSQVQGTNKDNYIYFWVYNSIDNDPWILSPVHTNGYADDN